MLSATSCIVSLVPPAVVLAAYAAGRRAGKRTTVPWRPIFQLVDHRVRCLGHDRGRVQKEIEVWLHIPAWAWQEILGMRTPLDRRRLRAGAVRTMP
jgi:hypothetical protein